MAARQDGMLILDLREAGAKHLLSAAVWTSWVEAAAVGLERYHHPPPPPRPCVITCSEVQHAACVVWLPADDRTRASHANDLDATEWGAYVLAAAAVHAVAGWRVVARAQHGSGSDLIMMQDADPNPNAFVKLEVSGVGACAGEPGLAILRRRLREKIAQVRSGDLDRPGVAVVVGFEAARILVSEVQT